MLTSACCAYGFNAFNPYALARAVGARWDIPSKGLRVPAVAAQGHPTYRDLTRLPCDVPRVPGKTGQVSGYVFLSLIPWVHTVRLHALVPAIFLLLRKGGATKLRDRQGGSVFLLCGTCTGSARRHFSLPDRSRGDVLLCQPRSVPAPGPVGWWW